MTTRDWIITSKYGDYLPLYRLERIFGRHGLELPRSTLDDLRLDGRVRRAARTAPRIDGW
jgi:transposase